MSAQTPVIAKSLRSSSTSISASVLTSLGHMTGISLRVCMGVLKPPSIRTEYKKSKQLYYGKHLFFKCALHGLHHGFKVVQWLELRGLVHENVAFDPERKSFGELIRGVGAGRDCDWRGGGEHMSNAGRRERVSYRCNRVLPKSSAWFRGPRGRSRRTR